MILTKDEILKEIKRKKVAIQPLDTDSIGPASIDLKLGNRLRVFKKNKAVVSIDEAIDYKKITKVVDISKGYILKPGELVLGITKERITLADNICGWLQSRSRFARFGLMSHITAPFICPGVSNYQVLEIFNASNRKLKLRPSLKICQLILQQCRGSAKYQGRFKDQEL